MNNFSQHSSEREFVWKINSNLIQKKTEKREAKEPVLIKELVEKTFQKLSLQLLERMQALEIQVQNLYQENKQLKETLLSKDVA